MAELDYRAVTARQQQVWSEGDFARVGVAAVIVGELLCEAVDIHPGERVLDVASGSGNMALAAARRFGEVTASDFVPPGTGPRTARWSSKATTPRWWRFEPERRPVGCGAGGGLLRCARLALSPLEC